MLITREPGGEKKVQFRIRLSESVFDEITAYCQWAGIRVRDYFVEQACKYIFTHDPEWQASKEQKEQK